MQIPASLLISLPLWHQDTKKEEKHTMRPIGNSGVGEVVVAVVVVALALVAFSNTVIERTAVVI